MNTAQKNRNRRVLFINWKWRDLPLKLNEEFMEEHDVEKYLKNIELGRKEFFDEYQVVDVDDFRRIKDNNLKERETGDILVRVSIYNSEKGIKIIEKIIDKYNDGWSDLYLMLHRGEHFDHDDVKLLLDGIEPLDKVFLFAYGRDFIYYNLETRDGLLDDVGYFYVDIDTGYEVADDMYRIVKAKPFAKVWNYYRIEFKRKLSQLEGVLFKEAMALFINSEQENIPRDEFIREFSRDPIGKECVYIRIKSLLGFYDDIRNLDIDASEKAEKNLEILAKYEQVEQTSLIFDDARENLAHSENEDEEIIKLKFEALTDVLRPIFSPHSKKQIVRRKDFETVSKAFEVLRESIRGDNM